MITFINKYYNLSQMLKYKQSNFPKFSYQFVCKLNGVLLTIITNIYDKIVIYEKFLYNTTTNKLCHYRINYDYKTLALIRPPRIIQKKKKKEVSENFIKISNGLTEFIEICKKENDINNRKEMVSKLLKKINDFIKKNINNNLILK